MLLKDFTVTEHKNILDIYNSVCLALLDGMLKTGCETSVYIIGLVGGFMYQGGLELTM